VVMWRRPDTSIISIDSHHREVGAVRCMRAL